MRSWRKSTQNCIPGCVLAFALVATPALANRDPLPEHLDCAVISNANWFVNGITLREREEETSYTIHLNTVSGEWYLSNAYAASLTMDGGDFSVLSDGTAYPNRWIGLDDEGATQLRIEMTWAPEYPFVFLGFDNGLMAGKCAVPDEIFIFLR